MPNLWVTTNTRNNMSLSTKWFNNAPKKEDEENSTPCAKKKSDCLKVIQIILDGEASFEEQKHFDDHIAGCMPCFEQFNLDKSIKLAIQTKIDKMDVPTDLVNSIKLRIGEVF